MKVVPSIVRVLVHESGATFTSLLPPQLGSAPAVPLVAKARPAVAAPVASSTPAQVRIRPRAREGGLVGMVVLSPLLSFRPRRPLDWSWMDFAFDAVPRRLASYPNVLQA